MKYSYFFVFCYIFTNFITDGIGIPVHPKRNFDPNQLMQQYMKLRTNQGVFGSYHPNDVKETVDEYFSKDTQSKTLQKQTGHQNIPLAAIGFNPNGQSMFGGSQSSMWQFSTIYDPNKNLNNYISQTLAVGALGPNNDSKTSSSGTLEKQSKNKVGFDANALNSKIMSLIQNHNFEPGTSSGISYESTMEAQHTGKPLHQGFDAKLDFNPDILNSKLFTDIGYDPNTVNTNTITQFEPTIIKQMNQSVFQTLLSLPHGEYNIMDAAKEKDNTSTLLENGYSNKTDGTNTSQSGNAAASLTDTDYNMLQSFLKNSSQLSNSNTFYQSGQTLLSSFSGTQNNFNSFPGNIIFGNTNGDYGISNKNETTNTESSTAQGSNNVSPFNSNTNGYLAVPSTQFNVGLPLPQASNNNNNGSNNVISGSSLVGNIEGYQSGYPGIQAQNSLNTISENTLSGNNNGYHLSNQVHSSTDQSTNTGLLSSQVETSNPHVSNGNSMISSSTLTGNLHGYHAVNHILISNHHGDEGNTNENVQQTGAFVNTGSVVQTGKPKHFLSGVSSNIFHVTGIGSLGEVNNNTHLATGYIHSENQVGAFNNENVQASGIGTLGAVMQNINAPEIGAMSTGGSTNLIKPETGSSNVNHPFGSNAHAFGIGSLGDLAVSQSGDNYVATQNLNGFGMSSMTGTQGSQSGDGTSQTIANQKLFSGMVNPSGIGSLGDNNLKQYDSINFLNIGKMTNITQINNSTNLSYFLSGNRVGENFTQIGASSPGNANEVIYPIGLMGLGDKSRYEKGDI